MRNKRMPLYVIVSVLSMGALVFVSFIFLFFVFFGLGGWIDHVTQGR